MDLLLPLSGKHIQINVNQCKCWSATSKQPPWIEQELLRMQNLTGDWKCRTGGSPSEQPTVIFKSKRSFPLSILQLYGSPLNKKARSYCSAKIMKLQAFGTASASKSSFDKEVLIEPYFSNAKDKVGRCSKMLKYAQRTEN